ACWLPRRRYRSRRPSASAGKMDAAPEVVMVIRPARSSAIVPKIDRRVWAALSVVYIVWGSTYLAIRVADRTLPPFLMAGVRFILAGAIMYGWAVWRGHIRYERPTVRNWLAATIVGGALCLGGNGLVVWAELHIGSG